jgi:hypothetical protein
MMVATQSRFHQDMLDGEQVALKQLTLPIAGAPFRKDWETAIAV